MVESILTRGIAQSGELAPTKVRPRETRSARLKLSRAVDHQQALIAEVNAYLARDPITPEWVSVFGTTRQRARLRVTSGLPDQLAAIAGDLAHNLRNALDHLACALVLYNGATVKPRTRFPIVEREDDLEDELKRCMKGASSQALNFVRKLKPFVGGHRSLSRLSEIDIANSRRSLLVAPAVVGPAEVVHPAFPFLGVGSTAPGQSRFPVQHGDDLGVETDQASGPLPLKVAIELALEIPRHFSHATLSEFVPQLIDDVDQILARAEQDLFRSSALS